MTTQTPGEAIVTAEQIAAATSVFFMQMAGDCLKSNDSIEAWHECMRAAILATGLPQRVATLEARLQEAELQLQDEKTAYRLLSEQWNRCDIERAALARNQSHE